MKTRQVEKYNRAAEADKSSLETNPRVIFKRAIENCKPSMGLVTVKRGGKNYQVISGIARIFLLGALGGFAFCGGGGGGTNFPSSIFHELWNIVQV